MQPQSEADLLMLIRTKYGTLKENYYSANKTVKLSSLFNEAVIDIFNQWGEKFGFKTSSELKSVFAKSNKKKPIKGAVSPQTNPYRHPQKKVKNFSLDMSLQQQIELYNLNPDTYS